MLAPSPPEGVDDAGPTVAALSPGGLPVPPVATPGHEVRAEASDAGSSEEESETGSDSDNSSPARAAAASPAKPKKGKTRQAAPHELTGDNKSTRYTLISVFNPVRYAIQSRIWRSKVQS